MPASIFATARPVSAPVGRAALRASTGLPTGRPVETVMHLLRNYFGARPNTALVGAFREQDQDRSGRFSVLEFKAALRALNVDVTEGEAEDVFRHLDADGSGVLELSEFVNAMKAEAPPEETRWLRFGVGHHYVAPNPEPPALSGIKSSAGESGFARSLGVPVKQPRRTAPARADNELGRADQRRAEAALQALRNFFQQRHFRALFGCFQDHDQDNSGQFEITEFCAALGALNIDLSQVDRESLFRMLDKDGSGVLGIAEFMNAVRAEPSVEEAQWLRLGIGKQQLQPNREPPSTEGVKSSAGESGFSRSHSARARAPAPRLAERTASGADAAAESKVQSLREFVQARGNRSILRVFQTQDMNHSGKIELPGAPPRILSSPSISTAPATRVEAAASHFGHHDLPRALARSLATATRHTLARHLDTPHAVPHAPPPPPPPTRRNSHRSLARRVPQCAADDGSRHPTVGFGSDLPLLRQGWLWRARARRAHYRAEGRRALRDDAPRPHRQHPDPAPRSLT